MLCVLLVCLAACGSTQEAYDSGTYFHHSIANQETQEETESATETEAEEEFLLTAIDSIQESLQLYRYADGMEYRYYYGTVTRFLDKYGNSTTAEALTQGLLVTIGSVNSEGILTEVQISDRAWVYEDVTRFSVDEDYEMLKIGTGKYRYTDETIVLSGSDRLSMTDLMEGDTLCVVGVDKRILSVNVTTAQGTLALTNTELFEGSYLQLGTKIYAKITENMELSVAEGTYTLRVANDGWGGETEVTIARGQTTSVDLDSIKGDGPSYGKIQFVIDTASAELYIDGDKTDYEEPIELSYGKHSLIVTSDEYDTWERNLYVNSEEATLVISLADEEEDEEESEDSEDSDSESSEETSSESSGTSEAELRQEQLETIQDLISGLTDASSIVTN